MRNHKVSSKSKWWKSRVSRKVLARGRESSTVMIVMRQSQDKPTQNKEDLSQHQLLLHKVSNLLHNHRGYRV